MIHADSSSGNYLEIVSHSMSEWIILWLFKLSCILAQNNGSIILKITFLNSHHYCAESCLALALQGAIFSSFDLCNILLQYTCGTVRWNRFGTLRKTIEFILQYHKWMVKLGIFIGKTLLIDTDCFCYNTTRIIKIGYCLFMYNIKYCFI